MQHLSVSKFKYNIGNYFVYNLYGVWNSLEYQSMLLPYT